MSVTSAPALPAAGVWNVDPAHTTLGFLARHLVVTKVRGHFAEFEASLTIGDSLETSSVTATIAAASITTGDAKRDEHVRGVDFFDVANYPTVTFESGTVTVVDGTHFKVTGDFTIRGITKPLTLDVEYTGVARNPWGMDVIAVSATADIDREEWGLTWNAALESGGVLVSKRIQLEIDAQFTRAA